MHIVGYARSLSIVSLYAHNIFFVVACWQLLSTNGKAHTLCTRSRQHSSKMHHRWYRGKSLNINEDNDFQTWELVHKIQGKCIHRRYEQQISNTKPPRRENTQTKSKRRKKNRRKIWRLVKTDIFDIREAGRIFYLPGCVAFGQKYQIPNCLNKKVDCMHEQRALLF